MKFLLRLSDELHQQLKELAKKEQRSLHSQIIYMLQQQIDQLEQKEGKK